jgi:hypothetical protein
VCSTNLLSSALLTKRIAGSLIKEEGVEHRIHNSYVRFHLFFLSTDPIYFCLPEVFAVITSLLSFRRYLLYFLPPLHHLFPILPFISLFPSLPFISLSFCVSFCLCLFCPSSPLSCHFCFSLHIFLPPNHAMTVNKVKIKLSLCTIAMKMCRK